MWYGLDCLLDIKTQNIIFNSSVKPTVPVSISIMLIANALGGRGFPFRTIQYRALARLLYQTGRGYLYHFAIDLNSPV